jgi:hypothetical protein
MKPAERIIARFGGITALAKALGHRNPTTVQGWKERGFVPVRQIGAVVRAGQSLDPPLSHAEFFDVPQRVAS